MRRAVFLLLSLVIGLSALRADAFHYITPTLLQIPAEGQNPGTIQNPHWGGLRYVVFDTDADLLNSGSTGRQVFLFDLQERDVQALPGIHQLTTSPTDDSQRGRTGRRSKTIVYDARPGGMGARQIMLYDRRTGLRTALTAGGSDSKNASIDDGERVIVFESSADFFNTGAGGTQIYKIDLRKTLLNCPFPCPSSGNAGLTQLTNKTGNSKNAVTSNSGKAVAFESDADLMNVGQTENQIYLHDGKNDVLSRVTYGPGAARNASITRDGGRIVFESTANLVGLGSGGSQIYVYRRKKGTMQQITTAPSGNCTNASVSSNGHAVAFLSPDDLLGLGSTGPELYSFDLKKNFLVQLTDAPASVSAPAYASGVFTVFLADGDIAGNSSPGTQLYLINLFALGNQQVP